MENRTEFYRLERRKVLKLLRELKEELIKIKMRYVNTSFFYVKITL